MEEKKMTTNDNSTWVEVFTGASFETEVVKGLLEANGIRSTTKLFPPRVVKYLCEKYDIEI